MAFSPRNYPKVNSKNQKIEEEILKKQQSSTGIKDIKGWVKQSNKKGNYDEFDNLAEMHMENIKENGSEKQILDQLYMNLQLGVEEKLGEAKDFNEKFDELEEDLIKFDGRKIQKIQENQLQKSGALKETFKSQDSFQKMALKMEQERNQKQQMINKIYPQESQQQYEDRIYQELQKKKQFLKIKENKIDIDQSIREIDQTLSQTSQLLQLDLNKIESKQGKNLQKNVLTGVNNNSISYQNSKKLRHFNSSSPKSRINQNSSAFIHPNYIANNLSQQQHQQNSSMLPSLNLNNSKTQLQQDQIQNNSSNFKQNLTQKLNETRTNYPNNTQNIRDFQKIKSLFVQFKMECQKNSQMTFSKSLIFKEILNSLVEDIPQLQELLTEVIGDIEKMIICNDNDIYQKIGQITGQIYYKKRQSWASLLDRVFQQYDKFKQEMEQESKLRVDMIKKQQVKLDEYNNYFEKLKEDQDVVMELQQKDFEEEKNQLQYRLVNTTRENEQQRDLIGIQKENLRILKEFLIQNNYKIENLNLKESLDKNTKYNNDEKSFLVQDNLNNKNNKALQEENEKQLQRQIMHLKEDYADFQEQYKDKFIKLSIANDKIQQLELKLEEVLAQNSSLQQKVDSERDDYTPRPSIKELLENTEVTLPRGYLNRSTRDKIKYITVGVNDNIKTLRNQKNNFFVKQSELQASLEELKEENKFLMQSALKQAKKIPGLNIQRENETKNNKSDIDNNSQLGSQGQINLISGENQQNTDKILNDSITNDNQNNNNSQNQQSSKIPFFQKNYFFFFFFIKFVFFKKK